MEETLFNDFFGTEHMEIDHNTLFSIGNSTGAPALGTMEGGNTSLGFSTGAPLSTVGYGINSMSLPLDFSTDFSTEGRLLGDDSAVLTSLDATTNDPKLVMAGASLLSAFFAYTPPAALIFVFFPNNQPNSYVEKNAAAVYQSLHGNKKQTYCFPAIITESPSGHKTAAKLFQKNSLDRATETLDVWETLLQEYAGD